MRDFSFIVFSMQHRKKVQLEFEIAFFFQINHVPLVTVTFIVVIIHLFEIYEQPTSNDDGNKNQRKNPQLRSGTS